MKSDLDKTPSLQPFLVLIALVLPLLGTPVTAISLGDVCVCLELLRTWTLMLTHISCVGFAESLIWTKRNVDSCGPFGVCSGQTH